MAKIVTKNDWKISEMPKEHAVFQVKRHFTEAQLYTISKGHIPADMDDRWFFYREGEKLYVHRSWSGFCIFIIELNPTTDVHTIIVNRDPKQYNSDDLDDDIRLVNDLLDWWACPNFDELTINNRICKAIYFHKPEEPYGFLSNWYPSTFELDGLTFSSVEQYIMYKKCMQFGDREAANAVMATHSPAKQQAIARKAKGYNDVVWKGLRQPVAMRGLFEKFKQSPNLLEQLLETRDSYLVECAVSDRSWACGISLYDDARFNLANWKGSNILGFALMEVREMLACSTSSKVKHDKTK